MSPRDMDDPRVLPLLRACLFCRQPFASNPALAAPMVGRRVAFDPARGRLWLICDSCDAWNLAPLETRWEALEQLEWTTSHQARLLTRTANIALHEVDGAQIIRVGSSSLREEVWWRYGKVLRQRRERADHARTWGRIINALVSGAVIGLPLPNWRDADWNVDRLRRRLYGRYAWQGELACVRCGTTQRGILFDERNDVRLVHEDRAATLWIYCHRCGRRAAGAGLVLTDVAADLTLRRLLAHRHFAGAADQQLSRASTLVAEAGSGAALRLQVAEADMPIGLLHVEQSLALEIAVNEDRERALLELETPALENRWREEERIAAIADGELS